MKGWILVGDKSANLKDVDIFINGFIEKGVSLEKINAKDMAVASDSGHTVLIKEKTHCLPDFCISAFFGNYDYHNHSVLKMLEAKGILCINTYDCLINTRDKLKSIFMIKKALPDVILPKTLLYRNAFTESLIADTFSYPLIVKINKGAKGEGVHLVESYHELKRITAALNAKFDDEILLQEYIAPSKGKDLRVLVCGGKVVTAFIRSNNESFKSNLNKGGKIQFFTLPSELKIAALAIARTLDLSLGSVDFLLGEDVFYFCEANAMPGLSYVKAAKDKNLVNPLDCIVDNIKLQVSHYGSH